MFIDNELGKSRPCYAEFACSKCGRRWKSTKAWADYGQNCANCDALVRPSKISKNFVYICTKCQAIWHSAYSALGIKCKDCHFNVSPRDPDNSQDQEFIKAHKLRIRNVHNISNPNGEHDTALCEKCRVLQHPCRNGASDLISATPTLTFENDDDLYKNVSIYF